MVSSNKNLENVRRVKQERKLFIRSFKASNPCTDCLNYLPWFCMEFDHVVGVKKFMLGAVKTESIESILDEIEKCQLVCANCHKSRTFRRIHGLVHCRHTF